ncbi:tetratricopeptide repeat protein [Sphingomonas sinipercae]|uniref:Tetratricopeptide repeat protein n=2 Tax=Sphingomonas sinipercae TaxID=2714944 RepID=A0A6G7ZQR3_9SPHN|nr:tetratricopeptide repeat protein [Sphingomonas sinipercae]
MRISMRFLLLGAAGALVASPVVGQRPDNQIAPLSLDLERQAQREVVAGNLVDAAGLLETALAVDPRNRSAFVDLARVAQKQKLFGKAIRLTNKALELEPNDLDAIEVQGEAMVELGAVPRARENLAKLQRICTSGCRQVTQLSAVISRGPTVASVKPAGKSKSD